MPLTVATWNLQNFAEPKGGNSAAFRQKLRLIAATLAAVDADVIALQEIMDGEVAARIATALNALSGAGAYIAVNGQPDTRLNRVALVSRLPIIDTETESLGAWRLAPGESVMRLERVQGKIMTVPEPALPRPPVRVRVRLADNTTVDIINVHLKSKLLTFPGGGFSTQDAALRALATSLALERRTAEALSVRARVDELLAGGQRVVVLGDFNDGPEAATTRLLCGEGPKTQRLHNLTELIASEVRWSRKRDTTREMVDQILASDGLMPRQENAGPVPAVTVLNDDVPSILGRRRTNPRGAPDHALVYATFPLAD